MKNKRTAGKINRWEKSKIVLSLITILLPQLILTCVLLQEGCIVVAAILHYFFLAVFCWMLCEGIIIYVMFVKVIYHGFFQRMYFFWLIGWGKITLI